MAFEKGTIMTHESGVDLLVEWQIQGFSTLRKTDGAWYCSPYFSFGEEIWELGIYPNGASRRGTSGHVDLRLDKCYSGRSIRQSFSLSLKTAGGERHREEHYTKEFGDGDNWFHRFNRFVPRTELTTLRSDLLPDDVLTVVCIMKGSTSAGSDNGEASDARVNKSDVAEASGSSQAGTTITKASVLKWIKENCEVASKGKKRKTEAENILKWIEQNYHETSSDARKRKMAERNGTHSLCDDYKKILLDGRYHDLILKVGDKELRAHRDVLRVRSRVFESMLDHDMKEGNTGVIDVPDCDPDAMELFLSYVYSGKIEALDHGNLLALYYIADKYEIMELKRECSDFIKKSLSHTNICSVVQLALNHNDSGLLDCATEYFANNMVDIMKTVEWQSFLKENTTVGSELMIKSIKLKNAQS